MDYDIYRYNSELFAYHAGIEDIMTFTCVILNCLHIRLSARTEDRTMD